MVLIVKLSGREKTDKIHRATSSFFITVLERKRDNCLCPVVAVDQLIGVWLSRASRIFLLFSVSRFYSSPYSIATNRMIPQTSITPFIAASPVSTYQVCQICMHLSMYPHLMIMFWMWTKAKRIQQKIVCVPACFTHALNQGFFSSTQVPLSVGYQVFSGFFTLSNKSHHAFVLFQSVFQVLSILLHFQLTRAKVCHA